MHKNKPIISHKILKLTTGLDSAYQFQPELRPGAHWVSLQTPSWWGVGLLPPPEEPHPATTLWPLGFGFLALLCRPPAPPKIKSGYGFLCVWDGGL